MDVFRETLQGWHNYNFMAGGAAATLVGLMFVAVSMSMHLISEETREGMKHFVTPSIFYFTSALLLSCTLLVPIHTPTSLAVILLLGGAFGLTTALGYALRLIAAARQYQDFDLTEWLSQVVGPLMSYGFIIGSAVLLLLDQWSWALMGLWIASVLLLLCAIANTWSMVRWIVDQRGE